MSGHGEKPALLMSLQAQRTHVLDILEGLGDDALRARVLPSGWSCLGLVRHLALDDERFWFRGVVAGDPVVRDEVDEVDGVAGPRADPWQVASDVPGEAVLDLYRQECLSADAVLASASLDAAPLWWPPQMGPQWLGDVRAVLLHVITETACHAGHLDAARELLDGRQWMVLGEQSAAAGRPATLM